MATKRKRGDSWQFIVKRAGLLEKPLAFTFKDESDGDEYCKKLEALLDRGIIPEEHKESPDIFLMGDMLRHYLKEANPRPKDVDIINALFPSIGATDLNKINAQWVDRWITSMKRELRLAPDTIRAKVGAVARAMDWGIRKKFVVLPDHPFRTLPQGYASYSKGDIAVTGKARKDMIRQRRLEPGEESSILEVIEWGALDRKYADYEIEDKDAVRDLFNLALESAMRLREMYTVEPSQVNLKTRTIYLDKTKNGDTRSVPLSSVALAIVKRRLKDKPEYLFPWGAWEQSPRGLKITSNFLSKLFQGIFKKAGCKDLRFHDLRAEAVSRLYERTEMSDIEIALVSGHKNLQVLRNHYARLRPSRLADKLW